MIRNSHIILLLVLLLAVLAATRLRAGEEVQIVVPSGQSVTLQEVIWDAPGPMGLTLRFRFVAPAIAPGGGVSFEQAVADMQSLCDGYALPRIAEFGPKPAQVIISLEDTALPFGSMEPDATQYFEAYSIGEEGCEWEIY
jgi:Family of unknown function (DUF6497)